MLDPQDLVGKAIGPYRVGRLLGQGGFAWVFEATPDEGEAVALKVLKPRYAGDPQFEKRFRNEAEVAAGLQQKNIIPIVDVGQADDHTYFAMSLCQDTLASLIEQRGPLPEPVALRIARELAAGLAFAHGAGFVHRDIKPDNILIMNDGTAVIGDFGIARAVSGYMTATGVNMTIGTPQYISPEQAQGRALDGRSDLYALGVALYKAMTGEVPFTSTDWFELARMHVEQQPVAPRKKRPDMSARFERVILRCLAKHPDDRYGSAVELLDELEEIGRESRSTETFGSAPATSQEYEASVAGDSGSSKWLLGVLAVLLVVVVAVTVVLLGR
jgi:serine/threonine-protein kinase